MNSQRFGETIDFGRFRPGPGFARNVRTLGLALLTLIFLVSGFYTIDPEEIGIVTRFGKYTRSTSPGLHFKIPLGVERVIKVPVQRQLKEEFGFRTVQPDIRSEFTTTGLGVESNMLTGDLNAAVVEWVVQYRIVDPFKFIFRVRGVQETFRAMSEAVMRQVVGDRTVNEILTVGRAEAASLVELELQRLCEQYETGIKVEQVVLQDVNPPEDVKMSFNEVNQAQQEREKLINLAQSEYNQVVPRAAGEAEQTVQRAEGYALDRVNRAHGDAARFKSYFAAYQNAPDVTRTRIYLETMGQILPKVRSKVVVDGALRSVLPLLNLDAPRSAKEDSR